MFKIHTIKRWLKTLQLRRLLFVLLFLIVGVTALYLARAAPARVALESEGSGCKDGVSVGTDTVASGGQFLQFGSGTGQTGGVPPCYTLVWSDEFKGATLDSSKWNVENGPRRGGVNTSQAVTVENDALNIRTYTENGTHYTGFVTSLNKYMPRYGYMEARVDMDDSPGMWTAFWLHNKSVATPGNPWNNGVEMDIFEHYVRDSQGNDVSGSVATALHWDGYGALHKMISPPGLRRGTGLANGYHTYSVRWTPTQQHYYIDGQYLWTVNDSSSSPVSKRHQHFILSSEIDNAGHAGKIPAGGYGSRSTSVTKLKFDYVRVYQDSPKVPPAPADLQAGAGNQRVTLTWAVSPNATGYRVKRSASPDGPFSTIANSGFTFTDANTDNATNRISYADTNVSNGSTYYYVVTAVNAKGESAASAKVQVSYPGLNLARNRPGVVSDSTSPGQQAAAAVDGNHFTGWQTNPGEPKTMYIDLGSAKPLGYVRIFWNKAYAKTYTIDISNDASNWQAVYLTNSGNGGGDQVVFAQKTARYVRVQLLEKGTSEYGYGIREFEVYSGVPGVPDTPTSTLAVAGNGKMEVSWDPVPGAKSYTVRRASDEANPYAYNLVADGVTGTTFSDTGLQNGMIYYYVITAKNDRGESSYSIEARDMPR